MEWRDTGIVLGARRHGESSLVVTLLTADHGRHAGFAKGGAGKAARGMYQPGNLVSCTWKGRLEEHLGHWTCELLEANAAALMGDAGRLAALTSACAVIDATAAEREALPGLHDATLALLTALEGADWAGAYVHWEALLLAELGFGLDLSACAATGTTDDLIYVSPKTGRAVSAEAGAPYKDKLLPLPPFLRGEGAADAAAVRQGLRLTGYFLERFALAAAGRPMPPARRRLLERLG